MSEGSHLPQCKRPDDAVQPRSERELKAIRYIVGAVNQDALKVWAELWQELDRGLANHGLAVSPPAEGFTPSSGWAEFLEKFWLLKHYLDYTQQLVKRGPDEPSAK